jgi:alpha-tubulin suppressor-like RCC1 family protein
MMAMEQGGRLFGYGDGEKGCLGLGDGNPRPVIIPITYFESRRVIDIACGDKFTVILAEVEPQDDLVSVNQIQIGNHQGT